MACNSAEAELRALAHGTCEGMWIQRLLSELQLEGHQSVELICDNQATISIAKNHVHHDRTKQVEVDRHFISEKIERKTMNLNYIPTRLQLVEILTKALFRANFEELITKCIKENNGCSWSTPCAWISW